MRVLVHGGAGEVPEEPESRRATLEAAAEAGAAASGPVEAVVETVRVLESSPQFNAGVGGSVQVDGTVRTDAGIMTGDRAAGAACSMPGVEHAVEVARVVMEETPHVLVSGEGALDLAAAFGIDTDVDLLADRTRERWAGDEPPEGVRAQLAWLRERFGAPHTGGAGHDRDTVGAVAAEDGEVAAATSTGGRWLALAGRVGDVPQIGSGFYASPAGGASTTGAGEDIARVTLARRAVDHLEAGRGASTAAEDAIEEFEEITGSRAGVIVLGADGEAGTAFNSPAMQTALAGE